MSPTHVLRPSHTTARHRIFTANVHISAATLIAAPLLMLMLLWHISTITLVENYMMPEWWVKAFLAEHANGWRVGVWVLVGVLVPFDCVHALLCLDWWSAMLYERGGKGDAGVVGEEKRDGKKMGDGSAHDGLDDMGQEHLDHGHCQSIHSRARSSVSASAASGTVSSSNARPHSYHPFLHKNRSTVTRSVLLTIYDVCTLSALAAHIATYFVSLPTALAFCSIPAVLSYPD